MRTRKEIENAERDHFVLDKIDDHLIIELLLDIREILSNQN